MARSVVHQRCPTWTVDQTLFLEHSASKIVEQPFVRNVEPSEAVIIRFVGRTLLSFHVSTNIFNVSLFLSQENLFAHFLQIFFFNLLKVIVFIFVYHILSCIQLEKKGCKYLLCFQEWWGSTKRIILRRNADLANNSSVLF